MYEYGVEKKEIGYRTQSLLTAEIQKRNNGAVIEMLWFP